MIFHFDSMIIEEKIINKKKIKLYFQKNKLHCHPKFKQANHINSKPSKLTQLRCSLVVKNLVIGKKNVGNVAVNGG